MNQQLGTVFIQHVDPSLDTSIHIRLCKNICNSSFKGSNTLFWSLQALTHMLAYTHTDTNTNTIHNARK